MARKNIFAGLTREKLTAVNSGPAPASPASGLNAFASRGAPGSLSRSIGDLADKANAAKELEAKLTAGQTVVDLDANLIDPSFIADRIADSNDDAYEALKNAIVRHGQGSPILVRPHPTTPGRYQVAFGHRRLRVAKDLGREVRAVIKSLSDQELVLAQGQENSIRTDLSFIERARFAQCLVDRDYRRDIVMAALGVDKTTVSRMLSITSRIPSEVIGAVGPAPNTGRDRWIELSSHFAANPAPNGFEDLFQSQAFRTAASDDRFNQLVDRFTTAAHSVGQPGAKQRGQGARDDVQRWGPSRGDTLVTLRHNARSCVITIAINARLPDLAIFS
jgi:ParB family chromosome partitioning protein